MVAPSLRTLIIEDNRGYAEMLSQMLAGSRDSAFSAETASTLVDGLALLSARRFDLVLLDLHLPDTDGAAACEAVLAASPWIAIVVVSGSAEYEGSAAECLQKGAQDYLVKGELDCRSLLHSVRYAVQRKKIETEINSAQNALVDTNKELVEKVRELDRLNAIMMGREERILEMKEEIKVLKEQLLTPRAVP